MVVHITIDNIDKKRNTLWAMGLMETMCFKFDEFDYWHFTDSYLYYNSQIHQTIYTTMGSR